MKESEHEANKGEQMRHGGMRNVDRRDGEVFWGDWGGGMLMGAWHWWSGGGLQERHVHRNLSLWLFICGLAALQ